MEQIHHLRSTLDPKMDVTDDNHVEGMKMETDSKQTMDNDSPAGLSEETHQNVTIREGPSSSCGRLRVRSRPKLQSTKSFPPYSQCIGGLGEDGEQDNMTAHHPNLRHDGTMKEGVNESVQGTERKEDFEFNARCARGEVRAKWRTRRRERLGGSYEVDPDGWESTRWSGKRRVEETESDREHDDEEREGGTNREWKLWRSKNSSFEIEAKEEEDEERKRSPVSTAVEGENKSSRETPEVEEAEELPGIVEGPTAHQWSSPHPILSKILQSSSTSSSSSSINLSSAESDEVFSEGEDAVSRRRTFRKSRSWKTFLTMMHWSMRRQSSWVQLAGHQGNFQLSDSGEVLKLYSEVEAKCLDSLMRDPLRPFVPQYHGLVTRGEQCYIRLEDLLSGLRRPVIMDCKMGVRTYQEEELIKARIKAPLRSDMYQKMVKVDPSAPSAEEHAQKAVTKWRYLQWRDTTSSTSTLGFRIEGVMMEDGSVQRDFRKILSLTQVTEALLYFTRSQLEILKAYHSRLLALSDALKTSVFFRSHEVIGSSLLFVHDHTSKANVWMIDFGKTTPLPETRELLHNIPWAEGNREDGYLIGLTSLITSLSQAISVASWQQEDDCGGEKIQLHEVK
ncbi:inositol-trisphosphate 3-kinase A [Acanthopagrus latus]|uniref:inositol-trisphosphate 3-kinase A n=1 Tax=Acanthopagrus latus TaxID=8177 RepID=UPI00187CECE7|nr:inositol-trisphosphate 3-kinase A [Acanthopagrus latus]XP_036934049.1 inositol-trisphosphate 3-kinase A [Acanthopagrus latus]XP_036934050.1 inositol-trisphosphate 3-kinase A [Acanthopagrus latus]